MTKDDRYRRGVGVMLLNRNGKVFVGARIDNSDEAWQMPQGGIDQGEEPWATALRELEEETGIGPSLAERIATARSGSSTTCPRSFAESSGAASGRGRTRTGTCVRFLGERQRRRHRDQASRVPEWKWVAPEQLPELIVPFKRELYRRLLSEFGGHF